MLPGTLWVLSLAVVGARARSTSSTSSVTTSSSSHHSTDTASNEFYTGTLSILSNVPAPDFTGSQYTYASPSSQVTVKTDTTSFNTSISASYSQSTVTSKIHSLTELSGATSTANSTNGTASSTTSAARPSNTVACNGYPEFCTRQYSNITQVCAHNSAFVIPNNAGSNQDLGVTTQLNDGIRMIQGETHWVNNTVFNCHTTCKLLNAGPWQSELELVAQWLRANPFDVVTWLIVNSDFTKVENYVPAIQNSGIAEFLYEPAYVPQHRDQWPTLGEMILSGKRLVMFMDYNANQTAVPYILDEFTHMWETPFSPTNQSFPCTQQRPPGLSAEKARDEYMYLANHNLNTAVDLNAILGADGTGKAPLLIPNTAEINMTNGLYDTYGQAGAMSENCTRDWGRPPNFILVDYYNFGDPYQGSVFEVAAKANGVKYNKHSCCGTTSAAGPPRMVRSGSALLAVTIALAVLVAW